MSGSTTERPARTPAAIASAISGVATTSCSPVTASTGDGDLAEPVAYVEAGQRLADGRVAEAVRVLQGVQQPGGDLGLALDEAGREPALARAVDHDRRAGGAHQLGSLVPAVGLADLRAGADQHGGG